MKIYSGWELWPESLKALGWRSEPSLYAELSLNCSCYLKIGGDRFRRDKENIKLHAEVQVPPKNLKPT